MLEATQIEKDRKAPPLPAFVIGPACWMLIGLFVMFLIGGTIFISLIPLIVKKDTSTLTASALKCTPQKVVFLLPKNSATREGTLSQASLAALRDVIQTQFRQSSDDFLATSQVEVHDASISTKNASKRFSRDTLGIRAEAIDEESVPDGDQFLSVSCTIKSGKYTCTRSYLKLFQEALAKLTLELKDVIVEDTTTTTVAPTRCSDTPGFMETITGHTCQTYADYGFCEEYKVLPDAPIDTKEAEANCCACGKR